MSKHDISKLRFHNEIHVQEVVEAAKQIAKYYQLKDKEYAIVIIAAYFHDIGYYKDGHCDHEKRGADIAKQFLKKKGVDEAMIDAIGNCILATHIPQSPKNLLEEIVCDTDLFHFGNNWFSVRNKLMRKEVEAGGTKIDKDEWRKNTTTLLESHHYHTSYCRNLLDKKKQQNIEQLKRKESETMINEEIENGKNPEKKKDKRPDRGIETMFRITSTNNQRLSNMADNKSNILITVNSIILSVVIALLLRKLDTDTHLILPTAILLCISLATMVIAILATRPSVPDGYHTVEEVKKKKVNLLFFGNFHRMNLEDYTTGMKQMMASFKDAIELKNELVCNQMILKNITEMIFIEQIIELKNDFLQDLFQLVNLVQPAVGNSCFKQNS